MPRHHRKINIKSIITLILGVLSLSALLAVVVININQNRDEFLDISLYYLRTQSNEWHTEPFRIRVTGQTRNELVWAAVERLQRLPELVAGSRSVPRDLVIECLLDGDECIVVLSEEYNELLLVDQSIALASLTYTLTEFEFIENLRFIADGDGVGTEVGASAMHRQNLLISSEDLEDNISTRTYRLYFADIGLTELLTMEREITIQPNIPLETLLIDQLIEGPSSRYYARLIPADVRLRGNTTLDGGICYVDFTTDFLTRIDNEDILLLTVNSIVSTIIENSNALQVQLLFAGDRTAAQLESVDLDKPLQ